MNGLISCVNFIKIDQVVLNMITLKVSNLLKFRIIINSKSQIIYDKTKHETILTSNRLHANEKMQVITVINENLEKN